MNTFGIGSKVSTLIWEQAPITSSDKLQKAIDTASTADVNALIKDPALVNLPLPNGEKALNYAIRQGRHEIVEQMLNAHTTQLDSVDAHGLTPMDHALLSKDKKMIGIVLGHTLGISIAKATESFSKTAKMYDSFKKETAFAKNVEQRCTPKTEALQGAFEAAVKGNLSLIYEMLKTGLDVNATTVDGWSLLHLAAKSSNSELVKLLLERGARTDLVTTTDGISALHVAATGSSRQTIQYLLDAKANLTATDKEGSTALHYAMTTRELFSAQLLIEKGANYTAANKLGISPMSLMVALATVRSNNRDELKINSMQMVMFAGVISSCAAASCEGDLQATLAILSFAATVIPLLMAFKETKSLASRVALIGTVGLSFIPGVNIIPQAWKTWVVGNAAFKGINAAWQHRHIETARPIRNAVVLGTNAIYSGKQLVDSVEWAGQVIAAAAKVASRVPEYIKDFPAMLRMELPKCQEMTQEQCYGEITKKEIERFQEEGFFTLYGGDVGSKTCVDKKLDACIEENHLNPGLYKHAEAILGVSGDKPLKELKTASKKVALKYKNSSDAERGAINIATERLVNSRQQNFDSREDWTSPQQNQNA